jgi:hypothetical protein
MCSDTSIGNPGLPVYAASDAVTLRSGFERNFTVAFPSDLTPARVRVSCAGKSVASKDFVVSGREVHLKALSGQEHTVSKAEPK